MPFPPELLPQITTLLKKYGPLEATLKQVWIPVENFKQRTNETTINYYYLMWKGRKYGWREPLLCCNGHKSISWRYSMKNQNYTVQKWLSWSATYYHTHSKWDLCSLLATHSTPHNNEAGSSGSPARYQIHLCNRSISSFDDTKLPRSYK